MLAYVTVAAQLPIGLQLSGTVLDEARIFRIVHAYEQSTDWHKAHPKLSTKLSYLFKLTRFTTDPFWISRRPADRYFGLPGYLEPAPKKTSMDLIFPVLLKLKTSTFRTTLLSVVTISTNRNRSSPLSAILM